MTPFEFTVYSLAAVGVFYGGRRALRFGRARWQEWQDNRIPKGYQPRKAKRWAR